MPTRAYHESLWEGVPAGLEAPDADLREEFLLEHVARVGEAVAGVGERAAGVDKGVGRRLRVLDVGCGEGRFAAALAREGAEVVAIDVAEEPLRRARAHHPDLDVRLVDADAPLPLADSSFDVVWGGEVIEHIADTSRWLSEVRRVLRSAGVLLISTPDHGLLSRLRLAISRNAFEAHFDPRADHLRFYTCRGLAVLLADFGFDEVEVAGAGGLPGARRVLLASGRRARF